MTDQGSGSARDEFAPDQARRDSTAKSPFSGVPYYVPSSQNGMRDKLPRINVPPAFSTILSRATSAEKVPQWKSQEAVLRFMVAVGAREVEKILDDPSVTKVVNQFSALARLETIEAATETSRKVLDMAERVLNDRRATDYERTEAATAVREAMEMTADPTYRRRMQYLLDDQQ